MAAVALRLRAEARVRWRSWLAVALLAGIAGGIALAAAAGTRRTDSALRRHVATYRFPDVSVGNSELFSTVQSLPRVAATSTRYLLAFAARDAHDRPILAYGPRATAVVMSADGNDGTKLELWKILSGRRPNDRRQDEALLDSRAAATFGVDVGDTIAVRVFGRDDPVDPTADPERSRIGRLVRLRVVGIKASTDTVDHPGGVVRLTPAFYSTSLADQLVGNDMDVRLRNGARDVPAFEHELDGVGSPYTVVRDEIAKTQRSIHLQVQALWLATGVGALLALMLVAQALFRVAAAASAEQPTLRALGATPPQLIALGAARAGLIASAAAVVAVGLAAALSPLAPVGLARELEPAPGFDLDPLVLPVGAAAIAIAVVVIGAAAAWRAGALARRGRPALTATRTTAAQLLARAGAPATVVSGVRLALGRARGPASLPVRTTVVAAVVGVAVAVAALTFSASLDHLFDTPRLYGQTWEYEVPLNSLYDRRAVTARLRRDGDVVAAALGADGADVTLVSASGRSVDVGVRGMDNVKGSLDPVVLAGRAPRAPNEILLSGRTLHALGLHVGDAVRGGSHTTKPLRVVGRGVVSEGTADKPSRGAQMTFEGLRRISPAIPANCCGELQLRLAPRVDRDRALLRLGRSLGYPSGLPTAIADFGGVRRLPLVLSALLVALATAAVAHALITGVRRRRSELAILKTIGFDRRQVLATVAWQSSTFAAVGLLLGIPLGLAAGRWAWYVFASTLGVVRETVTPVPFILLLIPGAFLVANVVALIPGRLAARTEAAVVLRSE